MTVEQHFRFESMPQPQNASFEVRVLRGLWFKQAAATLVIAVTLGLAASGWQLLSDYRTMHDDVRDGALAHLTLVRGLAVEAAYQLSFELAGEVVGGLAGEDAVVEAELTDNYGGILAAVRRDAAPTAFPAWAEALFGDVVVHRLALVARTPDGAATGVGQLTLRLDPGALLTRYLDRVAAAVWGSMAAAVALCALVVAVFTVMITRPLMTIVRAIAAVDPSRPGAVPVEAPHRHRQDELGLLVATVNAMLQGSQMGLDGRDRAESELAALARNLERRVEERTAALARETEELQRAKTQLEMANAFISDGIRYASRIQNALLPAPGALDAVVDEAAVAWMPLDIVGGDYWWTGHFDGKAVVAVIDCTGHGVPGAFMTAVVASSLNRILHHHCHDDPGEVLRELNRLVKTALRQDREGAMSDDGLDAAICVIDRAKGSLRFAGANLPLLVGDGDGLRVIKGNRVSLGYVSTPLECRFTTHEVAFAPGTTFYLFTDGVTDHLGGEKRRLFGRRRVEAALSAVAALPLDDQMAALMAALDAWRGAEPRRDDLTFVAFRPLRG